MRAWLAYSFALIALSPQFPPGGQSRPPSPPSRPTSGGEQARGAQPRSRSATGDALDRYARGDYEGALSKLQALGGFNIEQAALWIRSAGLDASPRRRLIAATLVLELADSKDAWPAQIVEWACTSFREGSTQPQFGEVLWMRASVALAEREGIWTFLMPETFGKPAMPAGAAWAGAPVPPVISHLSHGRGRFPNNPFFKLAEAVGAEVAASASLDPRIVRTDQTPVTFDRLTAAVDNPDSLPAAQREQLGFARDRLTPLLADPEVGGEAQLRLGYVKMRLGQIEDARSHLLAAGKATDPVVRYLAHLYQGWLLARDGHHDAASLEYRAALGDVPGARAAASLLTSTLMMSDHLSDAETFATDFMSAGTVVDDPWAGYLKGDGRIYPDLLRQLREAIK